MSQLGLPVVCPGHSRPLAEVQYSGSTPHGTFLISACHDKMPMLRHAESGNWVGTFDGHKGAVWSAAIDTSASIAVTGSADFSVKVWDALTGEELITFEHKHVVKSVVLTGDGSKVLTGGHEKLLRVYDISPLRHRMLQLKEPIVEVECASQIRKIVMLQDDEWAATGETNGVVSIWSVVDGRPITTFQVPASESGGIMDMEASRNGSVLTVAAGRQVFFYDVNHDFVLLKSFDMPMSFGEEGGVSLHPTQPKFLAGGSDTWVRVFDYSSGEVIECHKGHHGPVRCLRYAPDGKTFASGSEDGTIRIWPNEVRGTHAVHSSGTP